MKQTGELKLPNIKFKALKFLTLFTVRSIQGPFRLQLMLLAHAWTAAMWATRISLLSKNLLLLKRYSPIIAINN